MNININPFDIKKEDYPIVEELLPFTIGFEIEGFLGSNFNIEEFKSIIDIKDVSFDSEEQRFRIGKSIKGLKTLLIITNKLKLYCLENKGSGIHYHLDFYNYDKFYNNTNLLENYKSFILSELENWNYSGSFNNRNFTIGGHSWARLNNSFKTIEFRIGEMTFDYFLILKRILHLSCIVKKINEDFELEQEKELKEITVEEIVGKRLIKF